MPPVDKPWAETVACRLRHLLYASTSIKKSEYLVSAAMMQGIDIRQREGILEITLPCLLPKRRQARSSEYLLDPLTAALEQYVKTHVVRRFRHCVVCFSHIYCQDLPERRGQLRGNRPKKLLFPLKIHIPFWSFSRLRNGIWILRPQRLKNEPLPVK